MAGVRNGPLVRQVVTQTGLQQLGAVPNGMTWLLKTVHLLNASSAEAVGYLQMNTGSGPPIAVVAPFTIASNEAFTWVGWTAMAPGDQLFLNSTEAPLHVWVVGAELPGAIP